MKNPFFLPALFALCCLAAGCDKSKCDKSVSINGVLPNSNPVGYEVLIKSNGLSDTAKVVFGTVEASSRPGGKVGEIIARVPAGLSGNVEVSVEEGDCIARSGGFIVSGSLPSNVQPSLKDFIISVPLPPSSIPLDGIENDWTNANTDSVRQGIHLKGNLVAGVYQLEGSTEFHKDNPYFQGNLGTGTANTNTNIIYLEIDRSAKIGGFVEHFDGFFIQKPDFLPFSTKPAILLVSRETGRQLLIYHPG